MEEREGHHVMCILPFTFASLVEFMAKIVHSQLVVFQISCFHS